MRNECEYCGNTFEKLSQLYMHKNTHTPSLLLHQNPHPVFGVDAKQVVHVHSNRSLSKPRKDSWRIDRNEDNKKPNMVNTYSRSIKRKRDEHDSEIEFVDSYDRNSKRQKYDKSEVVDSYDRIDNKIKRGIKKKYRIKIKIHQLVI